MTSNDITSLQIIATTKENQHIITFSESRALINIVAGLCKFHKLDEEKFEQCSLSEICVTDQNGEELSDTTQNQE